MAYGEGSGGGGNRQRDDETQAYLMEFFREIAKTEAFGGVYAALTEEERGKLNELAGQ